MFPFPIAKPQGCDIQTFYATPANSGANRQAKSWNKPVGVSHVYMMLIGAGSNGNGASTGGGSGAVTVWYGAAQHVPNSLIILPGGSEGQDTSIQYRGNSLVVLLTAQSGIGSGVGGASSSRPPFGASGFYNSVAGQNGTGGGVGPSSTTFLSGGTFSNIDVQSNYGYKNANNTGTGGAGFFQLQPIIVGVGASDVNAGGIGCGGGSTGTGAAGSGGPGMVLIASW